MSALHEGHGREATIGWPYVGRLEGSWNEYWPMSNQPHGGDSHDPIFKVHRHPLAAIKSIAAGLTSSGGCRNPSERRWDARAWNCATRFVPLPVPRGAIDAQTTCALGRPERLRLALHYWVKWNLLADRWATHKFAVETMTAADVMQQWCSHCTRARTCTCPASAELEILGTSGGGVSNYSSSAKQLHRSPLQRNAAADPSDQRVRRRRGHGKRKGPPLRWETLAAIDLNMTRAAIVLSKEYGYGLQEPKHESAGHEASQPEQG